MIITKQLITKKYDIIYIYDIKKYLLDKKQVKKLKIWIKNIKK